MGLTNDDDDAALASPLGIPASPAPARGRKRKLEPAEHAPESSRSSKARGTLVPIPVMQEVQSIVGSSRRNSTLKSEAKGSTSKRSATKKAGTTDEKRLRRFRAQPPQNFHDVFSRATTQRFYVISRTRCGTDECPEEVAELAGSTGNVYTVHIARQPECDCPHAKAGNQCKHWLYVMSRVLQAKFDLVYQLALLSSELRDIFAHAPPPIDGGTKGDESYTKNRKPIDGDCPICITEFDETTEEIVWCRAMCGQNIHRECFEKWAATKRQTSGNPRTDVACPYCRTTWQGDDDMIKKIKKGTVFNGEGYLNVADQLGISTIRDTSTYSDWGRRRGQYF